jgi:hypothetical protein
MLHQATFDAFQIVSLLDPSMCVGLQSSYANDNDLWDSLWLQVYGCHGGPNQQWVVTNW